MTMSVVRTERFRKSGRTRMMRSERMSSTTGMPMAKTPNHLPTSAEPVIAPSLPAWLATLSTALQLSPSRRAAWSSLQVK